jgi:flagellar hook-basal body complex protein FliE
MMEIQPIQFPVSLTQGPIAPIAPIAVDNAQNAAEVSPSSFKELLKKAVGDLNDSQIGANGAIQNLASGGEDNLHDVVIAMEKANLTLQYAIQIRNKVLEAYQSIIQMQI